MNAACEESATMAVGDAYQASGVDYTVLDRFKRMAQAQAQQTAAHVGRFGFTEVPQSRGESVYLIETPERYLAFVEEGLGTKNLIADAVEKLTGKTYYHAIAKDAVAMILNDLITLGARPVSVAMHCGVGSTNWFSNEARWTALIDGWKQACDEARCTWGPGETPTLKGVIDPDAMVLSGSAIGVIEPKSQRILGDGTDGDTIVMVESSGIHANGLTLARSIIEGLPQGYATTLPSGRTIGEALLAPTHLYSALMEKCLEAGTRVHYSINITGHGWRKLMRLPQQFVYRVTTIPTAQEEFTFLQQSGTVSDEEMYATFNMGAGYALIVDQRDTQKVIEAASTCGLKAWRAGVVERSDEKKVVIEPKGIEYNGDSLQVR